MIAFFAGLVIGTLIVALYSRLAYRRISAIYKARIEASDALLIEERQKAMDPPKAKRPRGQPSWPKRSVDRPI